MKRLLPVWLKRHLRWMVKAVKYRYRVHRIRKPILNNEPIKIIVGAAETHQPGWYSTNEQWLDITSEADWNSVFQGKAIVTNVVAEHVFEHLTEEGCREALRHIHRHMPAGCRIRIAVPDGYHPDPEYIRHVGIAGIGDDAADHKQLLNVDKLTEMLSESGFEPEHLEGYEKSGELIRKPIPAEQGFIYRSRCNTTEEGRKRWSFVDADTSLIVDGIRR